MTENNNSFGILLFDHKVQYFESIAIISPGQQKKVDHSGFFINSRIVQLSSFLPSLCSYILILENEIL